MTCTTTRHIPTRDGYDRWSAHYDAEDNPMTALDGLVVPALLGAPCGLRIVDLGCGTGRNLPLLAEGGNTVLGLDFSEGMLERAREAAAALPGVRVGAADLGAPLPLADASFDLVFTSLVLEHIADIRAFFREARRICAPGGRVLATTMHPAMFLRDIQAHFKDGDTEFRFQSHPHQVGDFLMAALDAGLVLARIEEHTADEALGATPRVEKFRGWPMLLAMDFRVPAGA